MRNLATIIFIILVIAVAGFATYFFLQRNPQLFGNQQRSGQQQRQQGERRQQEERLVPPNDAKREEEGRNEERQENPSVQQQQQLPDTLKVNAPKVNAEIKSPMRISGEARAWYFEAEFPVRVIDESGKELGVGQARALGDWMVDEFVPFEGAVSFNPGSATRGFVVFEKANPSGLPENDQSYAIPVTFAK